MLRGWQWKLVELTRRLWVRATLFSVLAVVTSLTAMLLDSAIPAGWGEKIGADSVSRILDILATSMLTITTFSLTTMVSAYTAATSDVTPRATKLLMSDTTTHNVLATFIGAFLFSLVGIIALSMEAYGAGGRVVLFVVTLLVILMIVTALLRWIDHLTRLGRVNETTKIVEHATEEALEHRWHLPHLGALPMPREDDAVFRAARPIAADAIGYIKHVDLERLQEMAAEAGGRFFLVAAPGTFVHRGRSLIRSSVAEIDADGIRACFTIGDERTYDQDPLYGLAVMAEIASRALSSGINDPGTAIDVIGRCVRLIALLSRAHDNPPPPPEFDRLHVDALPVLECFEHAFAPIVRDGAGILEVQVRLQKAFCALADMGDAPTAEAARRLSAQSLERIENAMPLASDRERVRSAAVKWNRDVLLQ